MFLSSHEAVVLDELSGSLAQPFDNTDVLGPVYVLAREIHPYAFDYTRLVGEGMGSGIVLPIYEQLINSRRRAEGLPDVVASIVDDMKVNEVTISNLPEALDGKTLILAEVTNSGHNVRQLYQALGRLLGAESVDIATVGMLQGDMESEWMNDNSAFYLTPSAFSKAAGATLHYSSKFQWAGSQSMQNTYAKIHSAFAGLLDI